MPSNLTATISVQMKVNLGNYETADAFISVGGITTETTQSELEELLDGNVKISYDALKIRLYKKVQQFRENNHSG